jgi:hypothetical protein
VIAHVSLPALNCAKVAHVLAEMMGGGALRFPPGGPDAWNCWSRGNDFQIVVTPCGQMMVAGLREQIWVSRNATRDDPRAYESHFAIAVERSAADILEIAKAAGWQARVCNRGGMFEVVEVWVENAYLVEVLDPSQMADYARSMTIENWKQAFDLH